MKRIALVFLCLISVAAAMVWRAKSAKAQEGSASPRESAAVAVSIAQVGQRDMQVWLTGIGAVQASETVTVRPRVGGALEEVHFQEGAMVRQGDVLAQIDPRPYRAVLSQAEAKKAQDEAQLANARQALTRAESLIKENAVSRQVLDQAAASAGQLAAQVQADQAAVEAAQLDLDFTTVRAPISGRAGLRMVDAGNLVTASQDGGLVVLTQLQPVSVIFSIPQEKLAALQPHMKPGAEALTVQAMDDDGRTLAEGKLTLVDNRIDEATGNLKLKATFPNDDLALWPGLYVSARVLVDTKRAALVVPAEVVQPGLDGPFAYVVKEDRTVEARQLKPGMTLDGLTLVEDGLRHGERVVRDGQTKLKPGLQVSPTSTEL